MSVDLVFPAGSNGAVLKCIDIAIIDSPSVEGDETFIVTMTTANLVVELENNVTIVTIRNIDGNN